MVFPIALELQPKAELDLSRVGRSGGNNSRRGIHDSSTNAGLNEVLVVLRDSGKIEVRVIDDVKELRPEFYQTFFSQLGYGRVFIQRKVPVCQSRSYQNAASSRAA